MTPKQVRVMAAYFDATERLADATDDLIKAHSPPAEGLGVRLALSKDNKHERPN